MIIDVSVTLLAESRRFCDNKTEMCDGSQQYSYGSVMIYLFFIKNQNKTTENGERKKNIQNNWAYLLGMWQTL